MDRKTRLSISMIILSVVMSLSYSAYNFIADWGEKKDASAQSGIIPNAHDSLSVFENNFLPQQEEQQMEKLELKDPDIAPASTTSLSLVKPVLNPSAAGGIEAQAALAMPQSQPAAVIPQTAMQPSAPTVGVNQPAATAQNEQLPAAQQQLLQQSMQRYLQNPILQSFTADLQKALGPQANFGDVLKPDFDKTAAKNPQVQKILLQYTKDPAFMALMQQMRSDKTFMAAFAQQAQSGAQQTAR